MATQKEVAYYRAIRQVVAALAAVNSLEIIFDTIVRSTARATQAGVSLVLLDSTRAKLIHSSSWGLPKAFLQKGLLDADRSLMEVVTGKPVAVTDAQHDSRVQYPELAAKAGIVSVLGVPLLVGSTVVGSIRVYAKQRTDFTDEDINFVTVMTNLASLAIRQDTMRRERQEAEMAKNPLETAGLLQAHRVVQAVFAHPSEEEFAHILDFYHIEWVYEPRSFPLKWEGDRPLEMFTPDFYLPGLDLYVELTTLKQNLVTEKNRKLRHLRELYPEIKIALLYKKDFDRLLAKYGYGPMAQARGHGVSRVLYSTAEIQHRVRELAEQISSEYAGRHPIMVGVLRGVFCFMADLVRQMTVPVEVEFMAISYYSAGKSSVVKITKDTDLNIAGKPVILVEDIVDTGMTLNYMLNHLKAKQPASLTVCTLLDKRVRRIVDVPLDYIGFEVPDEFVVGYGLDYAEEYRNLPFIGILGPEEPQRKEND